jgi:glycine dehydrogenase subunit 1
VTYVPHTEADRHAMLEAMGIGSVGELFADVPGSVRNPVLGLPPSLSEVEILAELREMSESNACLDHYACFMGAGAYNHFVPSVVDAMIGRGEFYTAYTPYQPEISQGTLQAIYEYQTMVCRLTGMDVANASHYDGATALAEAALMAFEVNRRRKHKVIVAPDIHPEYRQVLRTYLGGMDLLLSGEEDLQVGLGDLMAMADEDTACVLVQNPSFLGELLSTDAINGLADTAHRVGALLVVAVDPIALGLFRPPGEYGADIVVGEGQPLGNPISFGGPHLGLFACRDRYKRRMPGRLVGATVDTQGRRGFVLTLAAREQHIRRAKATSNICTNQALCALAAGVYLATMGRHGLRRVAELCYHKAHYAARQIGELPDFEVLSKHFFKEFAVRCPRSPAEINAHLLDRKIIGGYDLGQDYPQLADCMLFCATEVNTREQIDRLVTALGDLGGV